jgi:hypothetical protein
MWSPRLWQIHGSSFFLEEVMMPCSHSSYHTALVSRFTSYIFVRAAQHAELMSYVGGSLAGTAATFGSYPFDLLRTILASQGEPKVLFLVLRTSYIICFSFNSVFLCCYVVVFQLGLLGKGRNFFLVNSSKFFKIISSDAIHPVYMRTWCCILSYMSLD